MSSQRWTAEKNIQFISEYEQNDCLWDPKHPQYKNMPARVTAYKMIMKAMEMDSVKDVVSKIRTLRNTYNNETLKAKKLNSRPNAEPYVSKIPWLPYLDFLKNIDTHTRESVIYGISNNSQDASGSETGNGLLVPRPFRRNKMKLRDQLIKVVDVLEKISKQYSSNQSQQQEQQEQQQQQQQQQIEPTREKDTPDEFDLFGQTVAEQLRQMPLERSLETEEMILATIRQQRFREVKYEPTSP